MKYGNDIRKQRLPVAKAPIDEYQENPRNYSYSGLGIIERYREMIRDLMGGEMTSEEIVRIYEDLFADLTLNSKPMITDLTIIAGDQRAFGEGIADAICSRIVEVPVDKKLPSLYLLDSIVKNIGCEYIDYFSARLPEVFLEAYRQVDRRQHPALRHLFGTWSKVFPDSVLLKIDVELQHMSDSPRPSHGIHVNPKYVEARRPSEHSSLDNDKQRARIALSPLRSYGPPTIPRDEYDVDRSDFLKGRVSPNVGSNRWFADRDDLRVEPDYKRSRATERDDRGTNDWWRKHSADRTYLKLDSSSAYNQVNDPRALIDAYGSDRRRDNNANWQDTPKALIDAYGTDRVTDRLTVGHLKEKNFSNKRTTGSWMNTEEEEYDWEDMNPTLADGGRSSNTFPASLPSQSASLRNRYGPVTLDGTSDSEFRMSYMSKSVPASVLTRGTHQDQQVHPGLLSSQSLFSGNGRGGGGISLQGSNNNSFGEDLPPLDYLSESGAQSYQPPIGALRRRPTTLDMNNGDATRAGLREWVMPRQKQTEEFNTVNGSNSVGNQGSSYSKFDTALHTAEPSSLQYPNQLPGYLSYTHTNQMQVNTLSQQFLSSQERHGIPQPMHHGNVPQRNTSSSSNNMPNQTGISYFPNTLLSGHAFVRGAPLSAPVARTPGQLSILQSSGYLQNTASTAPVGGHFSGLFSSLMSQGLISLTNQQDSVGVDFNPETLKLRHDSAIKALYTDLPRQCTTCGLRFNDQDLHRNHMDWHVTKNRMNKNRKQKASRKWFASASMWLSGTEVAGPEAVPGFLTTETVVEKQEEEEEEMAVAADEEQTTCELCGEAFDDFYCHETDEWMYRGAVYLNISAKSTTGLDRSSQIGPIVHAKCRPG